MYDTLKAGIQPGASMDDAFVHVIDHSTELEHQRQQKSNPAPPTDMDALAEHKYYNRLSTKARVILARKADRALRPLDAGFEQRAAAVLQSSSGRADLTDPEQRARLDACFPKRD